MNSPFRIYVHCPNAECGCHRAALTFLHSWGLEASFGYDGDHYLTFVIPENWPQVRIDHFTDRLDRNIVVKPPSPLTPE